jgi:23S rRNA pseudouridine1911/1915/1917 synthase
MADKSSLYVSSQGFEYGVKHFYSPLAARLTDTLVVALQISLQNAQELLNLGAVYVQNQRMTEDASIHEGALCRVHTKPRRYNCDYDWSSLVVYENQDFLVLNKPSGIPSHPSVDNRIENSLTQLALALKLELFITHRLDTLTAGLIVYAKNNSFVKSFNIQLQSRMIDKKYVALVETKNSLPPKLIHYMEPSPRAPKKVSPNFSETWALCELEILEQKILSGFSWVKINLLTGRTHQIRAQLSEMQAPILGDTLYGSKLPFPPNSIALRACELQLNWGAQRLVFNLPENFDF